MAWGGDRGRLVTSRPRASKKALTAARSSGVLISTETEVGSVSSNALGPRDPDLKGPGGETEAELEREGVERSGA